MLCQVSNSFFYGIIIILELCKLSLHRSQIFLARGGHTVFRLAVKLRFDCIIGKSTAKHVQAISGLIKNLLGITHFSC